MLVVPEQSLVTVTPEVLGGSNVLVVVLRRSLVVRQSGVSSTVSKMVRLLLVNPSTSDDENGSNNVDRNLLPELSSLLRVRDGLILEVNVGLTGNGVGSVGEGRANLGGRLGGSKATERGLGSGGSGDGTRKHGCSC